MSRYLLTIYQPDGPPPAPDVLDRIGAELDQLNHDLQREGSWVFAGALHPPYSATTVAGDQLLTDGPYLEGKEHVGGLWVIEVADLDAALAWARRASAATTLPIEVRPFQELPDR